MALERDTGGRVAAQLRERDLWTRIRVKGDSQHIG